jgi:gluconate 2-dehydrogenase alpha chain
MADRLDPVDIVTVGVGMTGIILARELATTGLKIVGLERGAMRDTVPEFQSPWMHDELRFAVRKALMMDTSRETFTVRNNTSQTALPLRRLQGFLPGTGVGGAMVHWNGQTYRFQVSDFVYRTRMEERYGKGFLDDDLTIRTGASPTTIWSRTTTTSNISAASAARPATSRARSCPAAIRSRAHARANIRRRR